MSDSPHLPAPQPTLPFLHAVLKNLTNLFTLGGDYILHGRTYKLNVWGCVALMLLSAICGAATDLAFNAAGYFWQIMNCLFTAAYSLYMRAAMDRVAQHTSDGKRLGEFSMVGWAVDALVHSSPLCSCQQHPTGDHHLLHAQVFYNNLLSLPCCLVLMALTGELHGVWQEPDLHNTTFLLVAGFSGLIGFAIRCACVDGCGTLPSSSLVCESACSCHHRAVIPLLLPPCLLQLHVALVPEHHHPQHLFPGGQLEQGAARAHRAAGVQRALDDAKPSQHPDGNPCGRGLCHCKEQELMMLYLNVEVSTAVRPDLFGFQHAFALNSTDGALSRSGPQKAHSCNQLPGLYSSEKAGRLFLPPLAARPLAATRFAASCALTTTSCSSSSSCIASSTSSKSASSSSSSWRTTASWVVGCCSLATCMPFCCVTAAARCTGTCLAAAPLLHSLCSSAGISQSGVNWRYSAMYWHTPLLTPCRCKQQAQDSHLVTPPHQHTRTHNKPTT